MGEMIATSLYSPNSGVGTKMLYYIYSPDLYYIPLAVLKGGWGRD